MDIERRLRLVNKISSLRKHTDCMEILAGLAREKHSRRKTLIGKGIIKIRDTGGVFGKNVWIKDTLVCILPDGCDRRRELTDAIFDTVCTLIERNKV